MSRPSLCEGLEGEYSLGLHVGSIFVVLGSSILGTCIPIITKFVPVLRNNPFFFVVAKTAATGVLLSVSCIHLISDAVIDFNEPCIDHKFKTFYSSYAFLFALVAALLMHAIDLQLAAVTERWMKMREEKEREEASVKETAMALKATAADDGDAGDARQAEATQEAELAAEPTALRDNSNEGRDAEVAVEERPGPGAVKNEKPVGSTVVEGLRELDSGSALFSPVEAEAALSDPGSGHHRVADGNNGNAKPPTIGSSAVCGATPEVRPTGYGQAHTHGHAHGDNHSGSEEGRSHRDHHEHSHDGDAAGFEACHGHSHAIVLPPSDVPQIRRIIAAICMEFGVTLHSLFVGLDIGLTTDRVLKPLLIALVFHQLFEGISLGSRLVDAKFRTVLEVVLAMVFSVSAPLGMVAATIAVSVRRDAMSGGGFVLMMAVLNSFCGGILLYLAFNLLFTDFPAELKIYGTDANPGKRAAMFIAVWVGMLAMALVGKWL